MFSYGYLAWPKEGDPRFNTEDQAVKAALEADRQAVTDDALGVWDDETGELLHIVYDERLFTGS